LVDGYIFTDGSINEEFNTEAQRQLIISLADEAISAGQGNTTAVLDPANNVPLTFSALKQIMIEGEDVPFSETKQAYVRLIINQLGGEQVKGKDAEDYFFGANYSFTPKPLSLQIASANNDLSGAYKTWNIDVTAEAATINKPVITIWGSNDGVIPTANIDLIRETVATSNFTSVVVENSFHFPQNDEPQTFVSAVLAFLASL